MPKARCSRFGRWTSRRSIFATRCRRFAAGSSRCRPAFAALKFHGRHYYEYARAGIDIPRKARAVEIHELTLLAWNAPEAVLDIACSKGTYVRVLAEDIGAALGGGAHLASLRRQ